MSEDFPYESFGVRLEVKEEHKIAWFKDDYDLQKHLTRYKLDKRKIKVIYRDGEPTQPNKRNKNSVSKGSGKITSGSAVKPTKRTKKLDSDRNSGGTRKSKK